MKEKTPDNPDSVKPSSRKRSKLRNLAGAMAIAGALGSTPAVEAGGRSDTIKREGGSILKGEASEKIRRRYEGEIFNLEMEKFVALSSLQTKEAMARLDYELKKYGIRGGNTITISQEGFNDVESGEYKMNVSGGGREAVLGDHGDLSEDDLILEREFAKNKFEYEKAMATLREKYKLADDTTARAGIEKDMEVLTAEFCNNNANTAAKAGKLRGKSRLLGEEERILDESLKVYLAQLSDRARGVARETELQIEALRKQEKHDQERLNSVGRIVGGFFKK